jgi:N utilization substance protein A
MHDLVISGAPVSVLIDHGLPESVIEKLVGADIGTVERLGSMTPEELEAIPEIDEGIVAQIQTAVMAFYGQYDQVEPTETEADAPAVAPEAAATVHEEVGSEELATGVLEHDTARHEGAHLVETDGGETLDLGTVEGLSAAPSTLTHQAGPEEIVEKHESGTIKDAE